MHGGSNTLHKPNTTNLHTHGLHVSGEAPYDYVLYNVEPGMSQTYTYIIQPDHLPGHLTRSTRSARTCPGASPTRTTPPSSPASASDRRRRRRRYRSRYRRR